MAWARSVALPAAALAVVQMGFVARMTRAAMLDIMHQDFMRTAAAKGLGRARIFSGTDCATRWSRS